MKYGKALRSIRRKSRMTQKELAADCGLTSSYVSHIEADRKKPTLDALEAICKSLKVKMSEFIAHAEKTK